MNGRLSTPRSLQPLYSELIFIVPICIFTAHVFVSFRQKENYLEIILKRGYWPAMVVSTLIAFLLIIYVKYITRYFTKRQMRYKWSKWFAQIVFGFLFAIALEFLCSVTYFSYHGIHISETVFFDSYLLPIVLFIMIINIWYADWIAISNDPIIRPVIVETIEIKNEPLELHMESLNIAEYAKSKNVVYIAISNGIHYSYDAENQSILWYWNIEKSIKDLPRTDYFRVGRSLILHWSIIERLNPEPHKRRLTLTLKAPFSETIEVARNSILRFNQWWDNHKAGN